MGPEEGLILQQIETLQERARSFRRRAEWMVNDTDRDRILAMAAGFDAEAIVLLKARRPS
ncbi:hypothetical protein BH10PSE1_BH10PSE1_00050 [soil metagenome]